MFFFKTETVYLRFINYQVLRIAITLIGASYIKVIYNSGVKYARTILLGVMVMIVAEAVSWLFSGHISSTISLIGIYLEFLVFSIVLSMKYRDYIIANSKLQLNNRILEMENLNIAKDMESRISKDLHDDIGGALVSIKYLLRKGDIAKSKNIVDEIQENIRHHIYLLNPENRSISECLF